MLKLQELQIADKTTLDAVKVDTGSIKTTVTDLSARGGFRYNALTSKPQVYDTVNNTWVDLEIGGGGTSTITIFNDNSAYTNKTFTVTHETNLFSDSITMTGESVSIQVPYLGKYYVTWQNASDQTLQQSVTVVGSGNTVFTLFTITEVSAFATISEAELRTVLEAHYYDKINLANYWSVGDKRIISLSAMSATGVGESHVAQDVEMAIAGFEIDNLVTPVNGHTKAAITLTQVDCLKEIGYMNSSNTNAGSWDGSARRAWCNNVYYNALPSNFKSLVKQVNKITAQAYNGSTNQTSADYCWLFAMKENGVDYNYHNATEKAALITYPYYSTLSNRIKNVNGAAGVWWSRSPGSYGSSYFCYVYSDGSGSYHSAGGAYGLALGMCL